MSATTPEPTPQEDKAPSFDHPITIASEADLIMARSFGVPIEGRDGNWICKGYSYKGKVYISAFEEVPL